MLRRTEILEDRDSKKTEILRTEILSTKILRTEILKER